MNTYSVLLLGLVLVLACTSPEPTSDKTFDKTAVKAEVREMLDAYFQAIEQEGLVAEFDFLDASEDFFWVPPGFQSAIDYDSVKAILLDKAPTFSQIAFEWEQLDIYALSPELATYTGIVKGQMTDTAQNTHPVAMLETGLVIKRQDSWKILSGQSRNQ